MPCLHAVSACLLPCHVVMRVLMRCHLVRLAIVGEEALLLPFLCFETRPGESVLLYSWLLRMAHHHLFPVLSALTLSPSTPRGPFACFSWLDYAMWCSSGSPLHGFTHLPFYLPASLSGSFARSKVNDMAGARSQLAGLCAGCVVLLAVLVALPWLWPMPSAVLGVVVTVAASR